MHFSLPNSALLLSVFLLLLDHLDLHLFSPLLSLSISLFIPVPVIYLALSSIIGSRHECDK
jgi:hypothetical protein